MRSRNIKKEKMKTLDEVIKAFEYTYENDPVAWTYGVDALHYLKEYRDLKEMTDWHEEMENIRNNLTNLLMNPPLTWDELKQMEGKPVWVEYEGYKPMWDIVDKIIDKRTIETYKCMLHDEGIGIHWQAYRKERGEQ